MGLILGNPAGLWALLGIPAVLLIHLIQQQSSEFKVSTLFLLQDLAPQSIEGRRIERLRNSLYLWLQLLAVLLITWTLIEPRWIRENSVQRVIVLLDSSLSMSAFRQRMDQTLQKRLLHLKETAGKTEWVLLETDVSKGTLYNGGDLNLLLARLREWHPHKGTHDFEPAFLLVQGLQRGAGVSLFVTDHLIEVPTGVSLLAIGEPRENVGMSGLRVFKENEAFKFETLIRNYSAKSQEREWWLEIAGKAGSKEKLKIAADSLLTLRGEIPRGVDEIKLKLTPDTFTFDDSAGILVPELKKMKIYLDSGLGTLTFIRRFIKGVEGLEQVAESAEAALSFLGEMPKISQKVSRHSVIFLFNKSGAKLSRDDIPVAENAPLLSGLHWEGLVAAALPGFESRKEDQVLVWQGEKPLIVLRANESGVFLIINFDLKVSNAARYPAFIVLLSRFIELAREETPGFERRNLDQNQLLRIFSANPLDNLLVKERLLATEIKSESIISSAQAKFLRVPSQPGFIEVLQGDTKLLSAAVQFSDGREADLRAAAEQELSNEAVSRLAQEHSREDSFWPVWILFLLCLMIANWGIQRKGVAV